MFSINAYSVTILEYKLYLHGVKVGKVVFKVGNNTLIAKGESTGIAKWLYKYNFAFKAVKDNYILLEKTKKKKKIYKNEDIYKKKPWLPLLAQFFKEDKEKYKKLKNKILQIKDNKIHVNVIENKDEEIFEFLPEKGKTKAIRFYVKKGEKYPYRIEIEGKLDMYLTLKDIKEQEIKDFNDVKIGKN